jgi:hypothetical protein
MEGSGDGYGSVQIITDLDPEGPKNLRTRIRNIAGQYCGSGFGFNGGPGSEIEEVKNDLKRKTVNKFHLLKSWMFLRAEGFSCSLDVIYEGLGISKLQFLINKR